MNSDLPRSVRQWGMWCHLAALACVLCNLFLVPFIGLLVPYLVWQSGRDRHPFVDDQGRASLNFHLSMAIYTIAILVLFALLFFVTCSVAMTAGSMSSAAGNTLGVLFIGGGFAYMAFVVLQLVVTLAAAVRAANGQSYHYPFSLRFLQ